MPEAVIVDAIRTPIGRAVKGSLKDVRTDDLAAIPLKALVERNPGVDFAETADVMMGCGFGIGEAGANVGRTATLLAGADPPRPPPPGHPLFAAPLPNPRVGVPPIKGRGGGPDTPGRAPA